jgi:hypothetical protein
MAAQQQGEPEQQKMLLQGSKGLASWPALLQQLHVRG